MNRRQFLAAASGLAATGLRPAMAATGPGSTIEAADYGVVPGPGDMSAALQRLIDAATAEGQAVKLAGGVYRVAGLVLPDGAVLNGVPGASRLVHSGRSGPLLSGDGGARLTLHGLTLKGTGVETGGEDSGLAAFRNVEDLRLTDCVLSGAEGNTLFLAGCGGVIDGCMLEGASDAALYARDSTGLTVSGNTVRDCGNGGILIHRSESGEDGSLILGNRIERIAARSGGSGQNGNGINIFRADAVISASNRIADCALSAIRYNAGSNAQVTGNSCLRSGETGIFIEFGYQGAVVADNLVDGASTGISITNLDVGGRLASCTGNIVRNLHTTIPYDDPSQGAGIGISVEADTAVSGNTVENAPSFGLLLGWGPYLRNVAATGNVIRDAGTGIGVSVVEGVGAVLISGNLISGAKAGNIVGYRWRDPATADLALTPEPHPGLTVTGNVAG